MKKIYLYATLATSLLSSLPLYAEDEIDDFGLYIGGDLTWSNWDYRMENNLTQTIPSTLADSVDFSLSDGDLNGEGRLGAYLRWEDPQFLTAIEIFAAGQDAHDSYWGMSRLELNTLAQEVTTQWSYGADLKQGYFIDESWLVFAKVGIIATQFKVNTEFGIQDRSSNEIYTTNTDETTLTGVRFGAGLERFLTEYISIAGQVLYVVYEDYNNTVSTTIEEANANISDEVKMDTHAIQFGLGVNIYFL